MKDNKYWAENYNLTGVAEGFSRMFSHHIGGMFEGNIHLIIYDRIHIKQIASSLSKLPFVDGWLPNKDDSKSQYDFIVIPEWVISKKQIETYLKPIKQKNYSIITLNVAKKFETMVVSLVM